jgi:hypothetical protein
LAIDASASERPTGVFSVTAVVVKNFFHATKKKGKNRVELSSPTSQHAIAGQRKPKLKTNKHILEFVGFRRVVNSGWTLVALQGFDLLTTLVAFRMRALEANPLVAHLVAMLGRFRGVVINKLMAIAIAEAVDFGGQYLLRSHHLLERDRYLGPTYQMKRIPRASVDNFGAGTTGAGIGQFSRVASMIRKICSGTLPRSLRSKGSPILFYLVTSTVRTPRSTSR